MPDFSFEHSPASSSKTRCQAISEKGPQAPPEARLFAVAARVRDFCTPLSNYLNRGLDTGRIPLPAMDMTFLALDALSHARAVAPDAVAAWHVFSGRVTALNRPGKLYRRGSWLQSDDGMILDFNRTDFDDGVRVCRQEDSVIAEYRCEKRCTETRASALLQVWRGQADGFPGFSARPQMLELFERMKQDVAAIMLTDCHPV